MAKRISLFKVLRRELGRQFTAEGYAEVPQDASSRNYILCYFKKRPHGRSHGFWFQRDVKSLFVEALGSSFTLEFFRSLANPCDLNSRERAYFLLTPPELEEMRSLQNNVIKRLPALESLFTPCEVGDFGSLAESRRQVIEEPFNPLHEVWMRYRDEADILTWTSFVGRLLPALAERFEAAKPQA